MAAHIDCELLINEVQTKKPLLWNNADENYKDKIKKNTACPFVYRSQFIG